MKIIDIRDINFKKLELLEVFSSESTLYFDNEQVYKLYDKHEVDVSKQKQEKILLLNECALPSNVVVPNTLIQNDNLMYGCIMKYIKNSKPLIKYKNENVFLKLLYEVSQSLSIIHNDARNIVVGDLHLNNILIDNNQNHFYVDIDSCMINGIREDRLPRNLMQYLINRSHYDIRASKETDKLCMILSIINALFDKDIDCLSMEEYDRKTIQTNMPIKLREVIIDIKNNKHDIPYVPYLHEIIESEDCIYTKTLKK